jgi:hypothetical protein
MLALNYEIRYTKLGIHDCVSNTIRTDESKSKGYNRLMKDVSSIKLTLVEQRS